MFNFDYITKEDIKEHNTNWKTNELLNLINHQPDIDKIYL